MLSQSNNIFQTHKFILWPKLFEIFLHSAKFCKKLRLKIKLEKVGKHVGPIENLKRFA